MKYEDLSQEQHLFIDLALQGEISLLMPVLAAGKRPPSRPFADSWAPIGGFYILPTTNC